MLVALKFMFLLSVRLCYSFKRNFSHFGILTARIDLTSRTSSSRKTSNHTVGSFEIKQVATAVKANETHDLKEALGLQGHSTGKIMSTPEIVAITLGIVSITLCIPLVYYGFEVERLPQVPVSIPVVDTKPLELTFVRTSGEPVATVEAQLWWSGRMLRDAVSKQLPSEEYVHSILFESDGCERQVMDFSPIGKLGIKNGFTMQVVLLRSWAIPSGVALLSSTQHASGPMGAKRIASLWLHEDRSVNLECGEFTDVAMANVKYLGGTFGDNGCLHLQDDGQDIEGIIEESHGGRYVTSLRVPILGEVDLQQQRADAVFDVSQTSAFVGWISLFEGAEILVKIEKKLVEGAPREKVHLLIKMWREILHDGSIKIGFGSLYDFQSWHIAETYTPCSLRCAMLCGPVGRRKLILDDFPLLGNVELIEHPFCRDMTTIASSS